MFADSCLRKAKPLTRTAANEWCCEFTLSATCGQPQQLLDDFVRYDQVALGVNRGLRVVAGTGVVDRDAAGNHRRDVARPAPREQLRLVRPVVRFEDQARPAIVCG